MRSSKSRSRNKSNRQRSIGNVVNRVFDSNGPEGKVRGTPQQIIEKYLTLARDAQLSNDRVAEQNFLQHAEHYTRMLGEAQRELAREQEERQRQNQHNQQGNGQGGNGQGHGPARERADQPRDGEGALQMPEAAEDLGSTLVETPETRRRAAGPIAEPAAAPAAAPAEAPAAAPAAPSAEAAEPAEAPKREKSPRTRRGPRKPKDPTAEAPAAPAEGA